MRFWLVCLGGAAGTGGRYLIGEWAAKAFGAGFPYGTLIVNVVGSFLISILMGLSLERGLLPNEARLILVTGVMGGFTTYSAFNYETLRMFSTGATGLAAANVAATLLGCLAAGLLGMALLRFVP